LLDAEVRELSPGEYALAGIARALIRDPRLVLIDDPESCATPDERDAIRLAVRNLRARAGLTVVLASASVGALTGANQLFALDGHGRLLSESREGTVLSFKRAKPRSETA
jgi:ABC-type branched-subunit amino acid transport system ATPase component